MVAIHFPSNCISTSANHILKEADTSWPAGCHMTTVGARHHYDRAVIISPLSTVDQSLPSNRSARVRICDSALFSFFVYLFFHLNFDQSLCLTAITLLISCTIFTTHCSLLQTLFLHTCKQPVETFLLPLWL